jgi:hypothetical protein
MSRKRRALFLLFALVPGLALIGFWAASLRESPPTQEYPELEAVPDLPVRQLLGVWPSAFEEPTEAFRDRLRREHSTTILRTLRDRWAGRVRGNCRQGRWPRDPDDATAGTALAARRDPDLNPLLLRMLADRELHQELRRRIVIALCWEGNTAAVDPLVDLALAHDEPAWLREDVLSRLPRIGTPLPERMKDLL